MKRGNLEGKTTNESRKQRLRLLAVDGSVLFIMDSVILANEALKLPAVERVQIIETLWQSLDPVEQASIEKNWLAESRERLKAYRAGELKAFDGEETLGEIERELKR